MHPTLFIVEVLLEIFAYLKPSGSASEKLLSRRSLAALATTCKPFHEPAMDLLWENLDDYGIKPLLGCVPRLYPLVYANGKRRFCSEGVKPLSEQEGRQFLRHAARVRSLYIPSDKHFHLLIGLPIETCVFPRLLVLRLYKDPGDQKNANHWHLFLSPVLLHCELPAIYSDLKSIGTRCPGLESLSLGSATVHPTDELLVKLLSETVRSCKQLKHLQCSPLDCASWKHLSNLPTLVTVTISEEYYSLQLDPDNVNFAPFVNITCLYFGMITAAYVITIMRHSEFPSLKMFMLNVMTLHFAEAGQLFHALSQCRACHTLECIDISCVNAFESLEPLLQNLLCFTQLRTIKLRLNSPIYLDNHLLMEAVSCWPHIRSLSFYSTRLVTFRGLFAALRLCPHLHTFAAEIDALNIDVDPDAESFQHTSLQTLDLGFSDVDDHQAVARIIFSMLPRICQVVPFRNRWQWDKVNRQLEYLRLSAVNV
ncbi:hypothetical protein K503DRAFT_226742 [Rhizopogon vinicolor AM-OR11-026]|uniref:F-box domain-containing protein n=1 Tax=Rhizopogon vinicolor AM-OR11-026 TaxID=1314800 RepID=A0A1B7MY88_9AGAM|nr:hypothetical protein K503DRAFT_226742 [Rhizopogon vinicolor AM-OR11-026]